MQWRALASNIVIRPPKDSVFRQTLRTGLRAQWVQLDCSVLARYRIGYSDAIGG